jgi:hypothetical protein
MLTGLTPVEHWVELPVASVPSELIAYEVMVLSPLLATNSAFPDELSTIADGVEPEAAPCPLADKCPVERSIVKGVTVLSPWVATYKNPVPEGELPLEQLKRKSNRRDDARKQRKRSPIPIHVLSEGLTRPTRTRSKGFSGALIVYQEMLA